MRTNLKRFKRLLAPRLDIPFSRDEANRFLPWFIALMVFLTAFFIAIGITISTVLEDKQQDVSHWLSVQIPASEQSSKNIDRVITLLEAKDYIAVVRKVPSSKVEQMLAPWFGDGPALDNLPLPVLFEAKLETRDGVDLDALRSELDTIDTRIELDDHQQWLDHYLSFIRMIAWAAYIMATIIIIATCVMIIFTSKTALKLHYNAVWLLHSVGAVDSYIARQFQFNAFLLGMRGALIGTTLAAVIFFTLGIFTSQFESSLLPSLPITGWHVTLWLFLPLITGGLAMLTTRRTVLTMLRQII